MNVYVFTIHFVTGGPTPIVIPFDNPPAIEQIAGSLTALGFDPTRLFKEAEPFPTPSEIAEQLDYMPPGKNGWPTLQRENGGVIFTIHKTVLRPGIPAPIGANDG